MIFVIGPPTATGKKNGTSTGACASAAVPNSVIKDAQNAPSNRFNSFIVPPLDFVIQAINVAAGSCASTGPRNPAASK